MYISDAAYDIDDAIQRQTSELEKIHLLAIFLRDNVIKVGQADKWDVFFFPIFLERVHVIRADSQYLRAACREIFILIAHARQLRAAMRSHESAQERKQDGFASAKTCQAHTIAIGIFKLEIGREFAGGNEGRVHVTYLTSSFTFFQIASNIFTVNFPVNVFCWLG